MLLRRAVSLLLPVVVLVFAGCRAASVSPDAGRQAPQIPDGAAQRSTVPIGTDLDGDGIPDVVAAQPEVDAVRRGVEALINQRRRAGDADPVPEVLEWLRGQAFVSRAVANPDNASISVRFADGSDELFLLKSFRTE